ncbi:MAG: methyltransferase domain-containing protein [Mariprofundaceae bacterium]|nr:methyltransferase domain-containing protein [Mariprofundaceae bacterium]
MDQKQRQRIIDKHRDSLTRYGYHPNALYWSGRDIQEIRFKVLADIGIQDGDSVLDVGCGFGDFKSWAVAQDIQLNYTGIDLSPDILAQAKSRHADGVFLLGDLFDMGFDEKSFDWVILSGALNEQLHDDSTYAKAVIKQMYTLCRKGVAFNMLDARFLKAHDLHSQIPEDILLYCQQICSDWLLVDDYLKNDFSMYMRRV